MPASVAAVDPVRAVASVAEIMETWGKTGDLPGKHTKNIQKTMENHHFSWENPLFRLGHVH